MKRNTETFAVCLIFSALMTAANAYAAIGTSQVMLRDCLGYVYAVLATGVLLWLFFTGKKRVKPEPGRLITADWEYFYFGAAVMAVTVSSFVEVFPQFIYFDSVTQGPYLITRMAFSCLGLAVSLLLFVAGAVKRPGVRGLSIAFAAIWSFIYVVSECTFFIPLPDISLYLPRLGTAVFVTLSFCYMAMAGKVGLRQNAAGLRTCTGALMIFSISDMVFWLVYHNNVFRTMPLSSFLFAVLFGFYSLWFSLTLDRKLTSQDPVEEVTVFEI